MPDELEYNSNLPLCSEPRGKGTILLVEDEEFVRAVAGEILQLEGFTVIEAGNPHEALERYESHNGSVDLLLTDVVMPGMDGHDLAQRLAQMQPSLKCIFMSGYTENALLRRGVRDLSATYLQKPFTLQELVNKVRQVLGNVNTHWQVQLGASATEGSDAAL